MTKPSNYTRTGRISAKKRKSKKYHTRMKLVYRIKFKCAKTLKPTGATCKDQMPSKHIFVHGAALNMHNAECKPS